MSILVIAEHDNAQLKGATLNVIAAAQKIGGDIHVLVAGAGVSAVAQQASQAAGVAKVLVADAASLADGLAENVAAQVLALAKDYGHILFAATASGKNVAPRVAAKLDVAQVSDIISVVSPDTFTRPIYAGNAIEDPRGGNIIGTAKISQAVLVNRARPLRYGADKLQRATTWPVRTLSSAASTMRSELMASSTWPLISRS